MGASVSKDTNRTAQQTIEESVDYGTTLPNGIYSATQQDFNLRIVRNLIVERKLAPFYKGLSDLPEQPNEPISIPSPPPTTATTSTSKVRSRSTSTSYSNNGTTIQGQDIKKALYKDAVECPICFLYYPANINHARCCDQPVCTECFLQIKRPVDTPSSPATCPFCMVDHFGVVYKPPTWKDSRSNNNSPGRSKVSPTTQARSNASSATATATAVIDGAEPPRRKNVSHDSPDVVLVDHVRPDWKNPKPTDSSSSSSPVPPRRNSDGRPAFFRNRRGILTRPNRSQSAATPLHHTTTATTQSQHPQQQHHQPRTSFYGMDFDIEEYMIMEAIRLSLQDQEAVRARNAAQGNTNESNGGVTSSSSEDNPATTTTTTGTTTPASDASNNNSTTR
ncbi:hypothetical protein O0I10_009399 [Lichtheimia ornata]|uniref:RING-type domain-containing protein n=1 Tax=Lichtheimia ornata TaxID=688661 RepID=A0AAD7UXM8_9FUNG|nr:uncharacterized protein O0I10_009399 [Lichtheimia ornata]KAJ8655003.1 hypothetical protein O0I10_009399 [Lichtheimia ornata]